MSTDLSYKLSDKNYSVRFILRTMANILDLSDFVRAAMSRNNLSFRAVEERSGGRISAGYVNDIVQRKTINPSMSKIAALADGLGVTQAEIISVIRGETAKQSSVLKERLENIGNRVFNLDKKNQAKAEILIESLESLVDKLAEQEGRETSQSDKVIKTEIIPVKNILSDETKVETGKKKKA